MTTDQFKPTFLDTAEHVVQERIEHQKQKKDTLTFERMNPMRPLDRPFTMGQLLTLQTDTVTVLIYGKRYDIPVSVSEHQLLTAIAQDEIVMLPVNFERTQLLLDIRKRRHNLNVN